MSELQVNNRVRDFRLSRGWTQMALAQRAGISRAAVSAIESHRLVPSVSAALALARVLGCTVEELFGTGSGGRTIEWAWPPRQSPCRYWLAEVAGRSLAYPVEQTPAGEMAHDGLSLDYVIPNLHSALAEQTLVMASCDPAVSLLSEAYARNTGLRLIVLARSSQQALDLLRDQLIHVAGIHFADARHPAGNAAAVQATVGNGYRLLRMGTWQEGLALAAGVSARSIGAVVRARQTNWVGRETGSAARRCFDELLGRRRPPLHIARSHWGVAEAVRCGWADAGVCHRLPCEEAGLRFLPVREEVYDLCFRDDFESDPRLYGLLELLRSMSFRKLLGDLPGYGVQSLGEVESLAGI